MEINYVYCLVDPQTLERRYVGKAKDPKQRLRDHLYPSYLKAETYKNRWLRKLVKQGLEPWLMILSEVNSELEDINGVEKFWIRILKQAGHRLTNGTVGGDGGNTTGKPGKPKTIPLSSEQHRAKSLKALEHALAKNCKHWIVISPSGEEQLIHNLSAFCNSLGLLSSKLAEVADGKNNRTHHKGWKCRRVV